jgi:hypothetical protein
MKKALRMLPILLVAGLSFPGAARATIRNVPTALYPTIQSAINASVSGDTVLLANGTYTGPGNKRLFFNSKDLTLQSSGGAANCIIDCQHDGNGLSLGFGLTAATRIEGITITGGRAFYGAGISIDGNSGATIANCVFTDNATDGIDGGSGVVVTDCLFTNNSGGANILSGSLSGCTFDNNNLNGLVNGVGLFVSDADVIGCHFTNNAGGGLQFSGAGSVSDCTFSGNGGSGMSINLGSPTVARCDFTNNTGGLYGGGMSISGYDIPNGLSPAVSDCAFTGNTANHGGGMYISGSSPTVTRCVFTSDQAIDSASPLIHDGMGGGLYIDGSGGGSPTVTHCDFTQNTATYGGGGMEINQPSGSIGTLNVLALDCAFTNNTSGSVGGGFHISGDLGPPSATLTNCLFLANASGHGGGIEIEYASPIITNATLVNNTASGAQASGPSGGGIWVGSVSSPAITNSIVWGNTSANGSDGLGVDSTSSAQALYSDIQDGFPGEGNLNADPRFVNRSGGDLHLSSGSPCIDAGTAAIASLPGTDLDGNPRVVGSAPDMGVYETQASANATISGAITLNGCVNAAQALTLTFRPTDGSGDITKTVTLNADGTFSLAGIPRKSYTLHIKGSKWLAQNMAVDASGGDIAGVTATLRPGDINNDNKVTIADLVLLADAFNTTPASPHWNASTDLNCDGKVNIADLGLLADNFGKSGDP